MFSAKTRDAIRPALFESFFVLLGVLLALGANEWRQHEKDEDRVRTAKLSILEEMRENRQAIATSHTYHASLLQLLNTPHEEDWVPDTRTVFSKGFILPANLYSTAWHSASDTGILANMKYEDVLALSRIYARQRRYEMMADSVSGIIYQALFEEGANAIGQNYHNLSAIISAFHYRETALLAQYDQAIAQAKQKKAQ